MARSTNQKDKPLPDHMVKARLVESIVAQFHEQEGVIVQTNVLLPSRSDGAHPREIDVLVTGSVAGHRVRIPIECKNYRKPITVAQIGEFQDKLEDVGLPVVDSIFVSVTGFDRGARRRAKDHGIVLCQLDGLTADRLGSVIHKAFQSNVYLLPRVEGIRFLSGTKLGNPDFWNVMFTTDRWGNYGDGLWDIIWKKWMEGGIPAELGVHTLDIEPPKGWDWHINHPSFFRTATVEIRVIGLVITAEGAANRHILRDIVAEKYKRAHIRAIFEDNPGAIKLTVVETDEELEAATHPGGIASIVFESERAPRIHVLHKLYWPPTDRAASVVTSRVKQAQVVGHLDESWFQGLTFEDLEGTDISAIWGKTWSGHPSSRGEDWPTRFHPDKPYAPRKTTVNRQGRPRADLAKRRSR